MTTGEQKEVQCSLVNAGTLTLENSGRSPKYTSLVVSGDMVIVIDCRACNVRLHSLNGGKLLAVTTKLESEPRSICLINDSEICVFRVESQIEIMSVQCKGDIGTITRGRKLQVKGGLVDCHAAMKFMDKVVVCGRQKDNTICLCTVSLHDGLAEIFHQLCKGDLHSRSYFTTKDNIIYISCFAGNENTGVHTYDIKNSSKVKYIYKHRHLPSPGGITVDKLGFIFVCNEFPPCIHHLTDGCHLVTIYREKIPASPHVIFFNQQHGDLYLLSKMSPVINRYECVYPDQQDHTASNNLVRDERKQPVIKEPFTSTEHGIMSSAPTDDSDIESVFSDSGLSSFSDASTVEDSGSMSDSPQYSPNTSPTPSHPRNDTVSRAARISSSSDASTVVDSGSTSDSPQSSPNASPTSLYPRNDTVYQGWGISSNPDASNVVDSSFSDASTVEDSGSMSDSPQYSPNTSPTPLHPRNDTVSRAARISNFFDASTVVDSESMPDSPKSSRSQGSGFFVDKGQSSVETDLLSSLQISKDYEDDKQDLQDEDTFLEAIRNNHQKVEKMIRNQKIPKQSIIKVAMKQDTYSKGVQLALTEMSQLLRRLISDSVSVWCGYRPDDPYTPVFVVTLKDQEIVIKKEDIPEPFIDYEIVTRHKYVPSDEERSIVERYGTNSVRSEDVAHVNNCIAIHTENLMRKHSNLSIIRPCSVKARGYINKTMEVAMDTCIVLYVPVKGIIPVGEEKFPGDIDGIVTDVREGEFVFFGGHNAMEYHPKLRMGCCIAGVKTGTLGGFIDLSNEKVGCLTAAHVVLSTGQIQEYIDMSDQDKRKLNDDLVQRKIQIEIHQPKLGPKCFGRVQAIALCAGNPKNPSVDAALVEITDDERKPLNGSFPEGDFEYVGFTKEDPMFYTSGDILYDIEHHQWGYPVIKFGCTTGITQGNLQWKGVSVRQVDTWGTYCFPTMFGQMEVNKYAFAAPGDSGALVFLCVGRNIRNLQAVGMVMGGTSTGCSCFITPIKDIFEKLELKMNRFKLFPPRQLSEQETMFEELYRRQETTSHSLSQHRSALDELSVKVNRLMTVEQNMDENLDKRLTRSEENIDKNMHEQITMVEQNMNKQITRAVQNMTKQITSVEENLNEQITRAAHNTNDSLNTIKQLVQDLISKS